MGDETTDAVTGQTGLMKDILHIKEELPETFRGVSSYNIQSSGLVTELKAVSQHMKRSKL